MKKYFISLFCIAAFCACTNEINELSSLPDDSQAKTINQVSLDKETAQKKFASILSKAIYSNAELRQFIKEEAIKQFDNDYDVFYPIVSNKEVYAGTTFRDILLTYCTSDVDLSQIEESLPLLNIYVPDLSLFEDINAYNWDIQDEEIPVAVANSNNGTTLFLNGDTISSLANNEIPNFHFLLIKNNERIRPVSITRNIGSNSITPGYEFIDDAFNGAKSHAIQTRSITYPIIDGDWIQDLDTCVIKAWNTMKSTNPSLQRDNIYYGISPTKEEGELKTTIDEFLFRFQIDPKAYYKITDQKGTADKKDDPMIKENESISNKISELSEDEIIRRLWTEGNYEIQFMIYTGSKDSDINAQKLTYNISPKEMFDIVIQKTKRHHTGFRHTKYTYRISPTDLKPKWYYPIINRDNARLYKWDISHKSIEKTISICEVDEGETYKKTESVTSTYIQNFKSSIDGSVNPGGDIVGDIKVGLGYDSSKSTTKTTTIEVTSQKGNDDLGTLRIYFYDSIIVKEDPTKGYRLKDISSGSVTITMLPMSEAYTRAHGF